MRSFHVLAPLFAILCMAQTPGPKPGGQKMPPMKLSKKLQQQIKICGLNPCMPMYRPSGCPPGCECVVSPFGPRVHFCAIYGKPLPKDAFSANAHTLYDRKSTWTRRPTSQ
uniref:Putative secreted protein n=1 Tax=Amblyomma americanum TaxID=6943 RepID=A0A0C9SD54_AMBAM